MRFALAVIVVSCFFLGAAAYRRGEPMVFPGYGVLRPLVHGITCMLAFFATSHWMTRLLISSRQPLPPPCSHTHPHSPHSEHVLPDSAAT